MTNARDVKLGAVALMGILLATAAGAQTPMQGLDPNNAPNPNRPAEAPHVLASGLGMALLGANVTSAGVILNGAGTTGSIHLGTGTYEVDFDRDVTTCFYSGSAFFGNVTLEMEPRSGAANGVFIRTEVAGSSTDNQFSLTVFCAN